MQDGTKTFPLPIHKAVRTANAIAKMKRCEMGFSDAMALHQAGKQIADALEVAQEQERAIIDAHCVKNENGELRVNENGDFIPIGEVHAREMGEQRRALLTSTVDIERIEIAPPDGCRISAEEIDAICDIIKFKGCEQ